MCMNLKSSFVVRVSPCRELLCQTLQKYDWKVESRKAAHNVFLTPFQPHRHLMGQTPRNIVPFRHRDECLRIPSVLQPVILIPLT